MAGKAKNLEDLLKLKGVVAAGEFTLDDKCRILIAEKLKREGFISQVAV